MGGVDLPIQARRRDTYIFSVDSPLDQDLPLTIDPTGVHMRSYGAHDYLVGCPPIGEDTAIDVDDFDHPQNTWERSARRVTGCVMVRNMWLTRELAGELSVSVHQVMEGRGHGE